MGHTPAQAVSRPLLTAVGKVQCQGSPGGIYGGQSGTRSDLRPSRSVFPCQLSFFFYSGFTHICQHPNSGLL